MPSVTKNPPGKPTTPTLVSRTQTAITVKTSAGSGSTPTSYRFRIGSPGIAAATISGTLTTRTVTSSQVTFTGLKANTPYEIDVIAINADGESSDSNNLRTSTLAERTLPPGPIRNLKSSDMTTTTISLKWDAPNSGGPVNDYDVRYRKVGLLSWTTVIHTGIATTHNVLGLVAGTSYEFEVQAKGHGGSSSWVRTTLKTNSEHHLLYFRLEI